MNNRMTKGLLASALALSLVLVACDSDDPVDGTTTPDVTETTLAELTTTTLAGSTTTVAP